MVLLSVGAAFAASDDDVAVGGVDEIAIDEGILAIDEDEDALEAADDADILADSAGNVVTNDTFFNYFDSNGLLLNNVTSDELEFDGDFSGVNVSVINIDRPVKFMGKNATFDDVFFAIVADNVTIDGFTFAGTHDSLIGIFQVENVTLSNNIINYHAVADKDCFAIFANVVDNLKLINNTITYVGNTNGTKFNNAVYIGGLSYENGEGDIVVVPSSNVVIDNNVFDISIPSVNVVYDLWSSTVYSEGIALYVCENVTFTNNELNVDYNNVSGTYDTIYALEVKSDAWTYDFDDDYNLIYPVVSKNVVISDNKFNVNGHNCTYALAVSGENFEVSGNVFNVTSDKYYAGAITVDGPSFNGVVKDNEINVAAEEVAYGIYSYAWAAPISGMVYDNNSIRGNAFAGCGMELVESGTTITNNAIYLFGNHTTGMAISSVNGTISQNTVYSGGNNVGNLSSDDPMIHEESTGISVRGNMVIESNTVVSSAIGVNLLQLGDMVLRDNNIGVLSNGIVSNYAVCVGGIDSLNMTGNEIKFYGSTDGVSITNGIYIYDAEDISISNNNMSIYIPSAPVAWAEVPAGSGNWVPATLSEGIVIESCTGVEFENNVVNVTYNNVTGVYDTIYAISVKDSDSVSIAENNITAFGHSYIYGIQISGDEFIISDNIIRVISDSSYANGIDVEGPASGIIRDNMIYTEAVDSVYAIYSSTFGQNISTEIIGNNIGAVAYAPFGMSLGGEKSVVRNNDVFLSGNYTTGIASNVGELKVTGSIIELISSEQGNESIQEAFGIESAGIKAIRGDVEIDDNLIFTRGKGVSLNCEHAVVSRNEIGVAANEDADAYAIYASDVDDLDIVNNTVIYKGATQGTGINNALYLYNVSSSEISENYFNLSLVSSYVPWEEVPPGSDVWVSFPVSEGIVLESSDYAQFTKNVLDITYNGVVGSFDTIYAVSFKDCDYATIYKNNITALGHTYIYGIQLSGYDFDIVDNIINVTSDSYYANGIDIEGPADGNIWGNDIYVAGVESAYCIYSGMNGQNVSNIIYGNNIYGEAYNVFGMSLGDVESGIAYNEIVLFGNYTTGIAYFGDDLYVGSNDIVLVSSEQGNLSVWDAFGVESVGIKVIKGNAVIEDSNITAQGKGVSLTGNVSAELKNNVINLTASEDADAYAVYAENIPQINMTDNVVYYTGKTKGTGINNAVYLYNVTKVSATGNEFNLSLVSCYVPWEEVPAGSGIYVAFPVSEGIVIESCDYADFNSNNVVVSHCGVAGPYDTIYAVCVKDCAGVLIRSNNISALGHTYIYGIQINAEDFGIINNSILVISDSYYANGIDVEGPAFGTISNNIISVRGVESAYAIYSGMNGQNVSNAIFNNTIAGVAYNVFGMSLGDVESIIQDNELILAGNYTTGIAYYGDLLMANGNCIDAVGSNIGNLTIWENFGVESIGIKVLKGKSQITYNDIYTTGFYAINVNNNNASVHDNYLLGKKFAGDESVANTANADVYNNTPMVVNKTSTIIAITGVNGDGSVSGILTDDEGDPLFTNEVCYSFDGVNGTVKTDSDGKFVITAGNGKLDIFFLEDSYYLASNATITLTDVTPSRKDPEFTINATSSVVKVNEMVNITWDIKDDATGMIIAVDNESVIVFDVSDDYFSCRYLEPGNYSIVAYYVGDDKYSNVTSNTVVIEVLDKITPFIDIIAPDEVAVGDEFIVLFDTNSTGNLSVLVGGESKEVVNGTVTCTAKELGDLIIIAVTSGNDEFNANYNSTVVSVVKHVSEANITVPSDVKVGDNATVDISIPGATGNASVIVDGKETSVPLVNGSASVAIDNVTAGDHSIVVVYPGDDTHDATYSASSFNVPVAVASEFVDIVISEDLNISFVLKDINGNVISNAAISYAVNGVANTTVTAADGSFVIPAAYGATIDVQYAGNETVLGTNTTLKLDIPAKIATRFNITNNAITINGYAVDTKAGEHGITYATTLLDADGNPISDVFIQFGVNNKIYNRTTYENGSFQPYHLDMSRAGRYTMAFSYGGSDKYNSTFAVVCVDLDKKPIKIKASNKSYKASATKKYTVTLSTIVGSSADGKAHLRSGLKVTMKINGKTYNAKTDSKGQVTFKLTNISKKGKYAASISYAGDSTYETATKSVKISVN